MHKFKTIVKGNIERVRERIARAAERNGRSETDVKLIAVTKYLSVEQTSVLPELGCYLLGESRPQILFDKAGSMTDSEIEWHMIGHLQRNKARRTLEFAKLIHSIDNCRLIQTIEQIAAEQIDSVQNSTVEILLEVNVSGDESKGGFKSSQLEEAFQVLSECKSILPQGFMCMGGLDSDDSALRLQFETLRRTRDAFQASTGLELPHLSMGMSGDFEIAIEEGATLVRVGSVLFEGAL